jgi:hypothetical protein
MSDTYLTPAHIHPRLDVFGNSQYFNFDNQFNSFVLFNRFAPTNLLNTGTNFDFTNTNYSGFRFRHVTDITNNQGVFSLNYFQSNDRVGIPLFTANTDNIFFNVNARGNAPLINNDYTNKLYVDSLVGNLPNQIILQGDIIGNGLVGQQINTTFQKTLNQISNNGNINVGNFLLNNVANPIFSLDAINLSYLQSYVAANKGTGTVTSITAGTGLSGGTITGSGTIALANISGFLAGVYNWPNSLTINQQGQVIGANAGNQPFTSLISGTGINISQGGGQALIKMVDNFINPGWFSLPTLHIDSTGRIDSISSGSIPLIDINNGTTSQLLASRIQGYPSSSGGFLRGDGQWVLPIIDITNNTTGQLNISRLQNYPFNSGVFLRGDGVWANAVTQFPVTVNTSSASIDVIGTYNSNSSAYATGIGFYNSANNYGVQFGYNNSTNEGYIWSSTPSAIKFGTNNSLRMIIDSSGNITQYDLTTHQSFNGNPCTRFYGTNGAPFYGNMYVSPYANYMSNISKYTMYYANSFCFDMWSSVSGGAAIVMNGQYIQFIQNFNSLGIIFSDYDYDTSSSYQSYIGANGQLYVSSSKEKKYSIREKRNNNYLDRVRKLKVYSYALKCEINSKDEKDSKDRKYYKNKQLHVGLLSEEVKELFDNCVDIYKSIAVDTDNEKDFVKITKKHDPSIPEDEYIKQKEEKRDIYAINYNALMCYLILAVQELADRFDNTRNM